jgi:hypothetical protein
MSATSNGQDFNFNGTLWVQQSYFDFLTQHQIDWKGYFSIDPWALFYFQDVFKPENIKNMHGIQRFYSDISE